MATPPIQKNLLKSFSNYRWLVHLLFWILLIGFSYLQIGKAGFSDTPDYPRHTNVLIFWIKVTVLILLSYGFQFFIIPLYERPRKHIFWLSLLGILALAFLIRVLLIKVAVLPLSGFAPESQQLLNIARRGFGSFLLPFIFFIALYYFLEIYDTQKSLRVLTQYKTQKIALESSFLKSQINPHFLFNTLNNIYALSLRKSPQTPEIIEKLESLLQYMLNECKADLVPLENEFSFTSSYIALEKLRHKEDQCTVTVEINGDPKGKMIAPLLLINFLENAFKHGTKTSFAKSWINLRIDITDQHIHFCLQNSKPFHNIGQAISDYQGGIGLKNVKRRLEILYPKRHILLMNNKKDRFEIDLTISI